MLTNSSKNYLQIKQTGFSATGTEQSLKGPYCVNIFYSCYEFVTIDEKLEDFCGRCSFRQYIRNKLAKYGLTLFAAVDAKTFNTSNLEVYVGQQPAGPYQQSYLLHYILHY